MATFTSFFPGGVYPESYTPSLPGFDYLPFFDEIVNLETAVQDGAATATLIKYTLANGLKLKVVGSSTGPGFTFDEDGYATAGTVTAFEVYLNNGTSKLQTLTGLNIALETFESAADSFDQFGMAQFLMRGNDTLIGTDGYHDLSGFAGNDKLIGGKDGAFMTGGEGVDTYDGTAGIDDVLNYGDAYNNTRAFQGVEVDAVLGTAVDPYGNDETFKKIEEFRGTQFADVLKGSDANETFIGFGGRDTIDGRGGNDWVRYNNDVGRGSTKGVTVNLTTGVAIDGFGRQDKLTNIENVRATQFADKIVGNSVANLLRSELGNDTLDGGAGADRMAGGQGDDTYTVDDLGDIIDEAINGGNGVDTVRSAVTFSLTTSATVQGVVENLVLIGSGVINGTGNASANLLTGNSRVNTLKGENGNDTLNGGLGLDTLTGGVGKDTFLFNTALASNIDKITDFVVADDTIQVDNAVFTGLTGTGALTAGQFRLGTTAVDADDHILYDAASGKLLYDKDGLGGTAAVQFATLGTGLGLTQADFFIV